MKVIDLIIIIILSIIIGGVTSFMYSSLTWEDQLASIHDFNEEYNELQ